MINSLHFIAIYDILCALSDPITGSVFYSKNFKQPKDKLNDRTRKGRAA